MKNKHFNPLSLFLVLLIAGCNTVPLTTSSGKTTENLFSRFMELEGEWISTPESVDMPPSTVTYRTIANGSSVVETVFAGTPHEMVSVIYLDGTQLRMTHYCAARNQPHLFANEITDNSVSFVTDHVSNLHDPGDLYMGEAEWVFIDENNIQTNWMSFQDGEESGAMVFNMKRAAD